LGFDCRDIVPIPYCTIYWSWTFVKSSQIRSNTHTLPKQQLCSRIFLGHYNVPIVKFWNSNYTILNYCLLNFWIIWIMFFWLYEEGLTLPIFSIVGMEIVAIFSWLSIFYMEIVVKSVSLDYYCIRNFETQGFVLWLIFTNGKVDYGLCAFDCDLWTQNVFLLFLAPPLAMHGCMFISPLTKSWSPNTYSRRCMCPQYIQAHMGLLSPLCRHLQITTHRYGHLPKKRIAMSPSPHIKFKPPMLFDMWVV
jgi:hypothetical protein